MLSLRAFFPSAAIGIALTMLAGAATAPQERFTARQRNYWAFQPVGSPEVPAVAKTSWVRNPIDAFILSKLTGKELTPSLEADQATLLRRVSLDLTGLPPTPDELRAFLDDKSDSAYEKVVDRLLASPRYGERWGRHWLD